MERSQVMETLKHLSDLNGPRLTGSPGLKQASEWSRDRLAKCGLANAHLAPWGEFGRGWSLQRFSAQITTPYALPLIAFPKAWSPSLGPSPFVSEVVHVDIKKPEDFAKFVADDLKQASAIVAAFVYQTAMRDEKLPRKPESGATPAPDVKSPAPTSQ